MTVTSFESREAEEFRSEVRAWALAAVPSEWRETVGALDEDESIRRRRAWDLTVRDGGYAGLAWPRAYGGRGLGLVEESIFYEEVAAAGAPDMLNMIGFDLAGPAIIEYGTEEQQARLLPRIISGEDLWCEGFSEPDAGSDLAAASTTATYSAAHDEYVIHGQKTWTSLAHLAQMCYLLARTSPERPKRHNLSVLLLDMRQDGIDVRRIRQITGDQEFNEVFFDGAIAKGDALLGERDHGWQLASLAGFRRERRIFDALRRYVQIERLVRLLESEVGGRTGVGERLATLRRELDLLRWHIRRCTELRAQGRDGSREMTILRVVWSLLWQRVVALGVESSRHQELWRREFLHARSVTIAGGTTQIQRNVIADRLLGLPRT